jgi:hypothetical protein
MSELDIRTQIYLSKEQHEMLKEKAGEKSVSMAHLIREAVAAYLIELEKTGPGLSGEDYLTDPVWQIPEMVKEWKPSGIRDLAENHDYYLYDLDKPDER